MAEFEDRVQLEIAQLKKICDCNCKVIKNIGDFAYVIVVYLKDKGISVTFQLTERYPEILPEVAIKGAEIEPESLRQLKIENRNPNLVDFIKFISERSVDDKETYKNMSVSPNKNAKCKGKKRHTCAASAEKKASMKTSEDVVKRIKWDPQLTSSDFTVGYLDRFLGILEKNFTAFNWDAFDSLDESETAIPKHRIQHFKYKDVIVWDKNRRVDNVFGSTGSGLTIIDVIENYVYDTSCATDADNCGDIVDDDDEIEIVTSRDEVIKNQRQHRPNYFLCQRITDPQVLAVVEDIQNKMVNNDAGFKNFIIPPQSLHLTLCTLGLYAKGDVDLVTEILHDNKEELSYLAAGLAIEIQGIDQFFNRVVYSKVLNNEKLLAFVEYLKLILQEKGLNTCDAYEFVPHITLMKVIRENCLKTIPKRLYDNFKSTEFGCQNIDELFLCEISKSRDDYGFYVCPTKLKL